MRYYLGVDWAGETPAVWVMSGDGTKITTRTVPHTVDGLTEWARELDERRGQGIELWAAISVRRPLSWIFCSTTGWSSIP